MEPIVVSPHWTGGHFYSFQKKKVDHMAGLGVTGDVEG